MPRTQPRQFYGPHPTPCETAPPGARTAWSPRSTLRRPLLRTADRDVRTHFLEPRFRNSFNREQVLDSLKRAALLAEIYNSLRGARADAGYLLKLLRRRSVQIDGMSGGALRLRANFQRDKEIQQDRENAQRASNQNHFIHNANYFCWPRQTRQ